MYAIPRIRPLLSIPMLQNLSWRYFSRASGFVTAIAWSTGDPDLTYLRKIQLNTGNSHNLWLAASQPGQHSATNLSLPLLLENESERDSKSLSERLRLVADRARALGIGVLDAGERRWQTENGRVILQLIGVNLTVYVMWKVLPMAFMLRHFTSSLEAIRRGRVWTTLTANFSHMSFLHLAANMYLLDQFGRDVVNVLTRERFVMLYLSGGLAAVMTSLASRRVLRNNVLSLGASGSVMAVLFMFANLFPERSIRFFGLYELPAKDAVILWALIDAAGLLGSFGKIDFAAHLGGGAFSFVYYNLVREALSREHFERKRAEKSWHDFRSVRHTSAEASWLRRQIDRIEKE